MSKKLIAVASAAALALTALVGVAPAMAVASFTIDGNAVATAGSPATISVPFDNSADPSNSTASDINITGLLTGDVVRVTSTGAVKLLEAVQVASANVNASTLGSQSITKTRTTNLDLDIFAFTTSTTAGTIKVEVTSANSTSSSTKHLKGVVGPAYNIIDVVGVPGTMAAGATADVTLKITDVFGNALAALTGGDVIDNPAGATDFGAVTYDVATKLWETELSAASTAVFIAGLEINGASGNDVDGLPDAKDSYVAVINSAAAAAANTALTAQVAALTAQLANSRGKDVSVTKKKYNNLAKRWNSAFPGQKVALKQ